ISFVVAENNQIIGQVPDSIDAETFVGQIVAIGLLEFVDFGESPVAVGMSVRTDFDYKYFPQVEGPIWHTVITNDGFESAYVTTDQSGRAAISFTLTMEGTKILSDFTTNNIGHYLGIVIDKVVISAPQVKTPITDGRGWIQGSFTQEEAQLLAAYLGIKGPLPLPLKVKQVMKNGN
ncbi:MAG TPA: hypothetical protein VK206_05285, partial [Anaerolineales bacterium]|nr:hypothetical protein [Anaerolineales bacterium]